MLVDAATADLSTVDLADPDLFADGPPHELFARMRAEAPVRWNPSAEGVGFWSLTRGEDITNVSEDPQTFSSARGGIFSRPDTLVPLALARNLGIFKDPPEHAKYRDIVAKAFLPHAMGPIDKMIRDIVTRTLDKVVRRGECDLVRDVAVPIPLNVIAWMLGVPDDDIPQLLAWTEDIGHGITYSTDRTQTFEQMAAYFQKLVESELARGGDSLASTVAQAEVDGEHLTQDEIATYFVMLVFASADPLRNAFSSGMLTLMEIPDQLELLRNDPGRLACTRSGIAPGALEEILRWSTPVNFFARTATKDTAIRGVDIKADDRLILWYASASRDPEVLAGADTFDPVGREQAQLSQTVRSRAIRTDPSLRPPRDLPHYAFGGGGPHFCQGVHLANKVLSIALQETLTRLPNICRAGPTSRVRSIWANSLASLPVTFTPTS